LDEEGHPQEPQQETTELENTLAGGPLSKQMVETRTG
jgi:hypothetical protein